MKKVFIKVLSAMLVVVITLTATPLSGFVGLELPDWFDFSINADAYSGICGYNVRCTFDTSTGTLTISGEGAMYDYYYGYNSYNRPWESYANNIKKIVIRYGVTSIGDYAFYNCDSITSVTIPNSVTTIGKETFYSCNSITSVTIPNSVTTISYGAFTACYELASVTIPDSVISIGEYAFDCCINLKGVTIPNGVTTIGKGAFEDCISLTSIIIPDSVISIGEAAFSCCQSLTDIIVDSNNEYYSNDKYGVLFNKDKTALKQYPNGNTRTNYIIPNSVTTIDENAFTGCDNLTSVVIPDSVTTIDKYTFNRCGSLTNVTIPDSVTLIGEYTFSFCYSLTSVLVGNGVTTIGKNAFYECNSLTSLVLGSSVTTIGENAFEGCDGLKSVTIAENVTTICDSAFDSCINLTSVAIPNSVISIGDYAFWRCESLKDVYYSGIEEEWKDISIEQGNGDLLYATIHYDCCLYNVNYQHSYTSEITFPATHTGTGLMTYTCTCGSTYTEEIEMVAHDYNSVVTKPTCIEEGYTTYICACGDSYTDDYVDELGHSYDNGVVIINPTCTENGVEKYTCGTCGNIFEKDVDKLGHDYSSNITEPECEERGYTTYICNTCNEIYVSDYKDALGHKYNSVIVQPTCLEDGYTTYTCYRCGDTYVSDQVSALGHTDGDVVEENYVAPTCTANGSKDNVTYCTACGVETSREKVVISATGHKYVNGKCEYCGDKDVYYYNGTFHIQTPSTTTIRHKDGIKLHAKVEGTAPKGSYVVWAASNSNFKTEEINDGNSLQIVSDKNGNTTFTATLYSEDGEVLATDTIEMKSKAGFFDKISSFFRLLFGEPTIHDR